MRLEITLAGDVAVSRHDGGERQGLSGPPRVVLAALVLERPEGVPRDHLADILWPEEMPRTWGSALRTHVSRVRGLLTRQIGDGGETIASTDGRYRLVLPLDVELDVDVERAEAALDGARRAATTDPADALRQATTAADLVRPSFLPGHVGPWVEQQRARLAEMLVGALEAASRAAGQLGDHPRAVATAEEAVRRAPLREGGHRALMAALDGAGNRAEALRAYHRLRRVLTDELGTDPSPETEAAYLDLLGPSGSGGPGVPGAPRASGEPGGAARPGGSSDPAAGGAEADVVERPDASRPPSPPAAGTAGSAGLPVGPVSVLGGARPAPFVGRRTELAALAEAWEQAVSGARHVVLVTGEAGIGKSRLTTEAARRVTAGGGLVLFGRCDPEDVVPYQPLVEALDGVVAEASPQDPPLVGEDALAELAAVLPSLARPRRTASPDRSRLFGAATELVTALARRRPLLLVLDDLQWADDDTLLLVRHLLRRAGDAPLLMVAIARDHDLEPGSALADVVHSLERDGWVRRVPLRGLREPDVRELLVHLRGAGDHAVAARRLLAETAGNPFLVTELAVAGGAGAPDDDAPARAGAVPVSSGDAGTPGRTPQGIPPGVRDLVTNRLARLTPATVDLLRAGAVAGGRFDLDIAGAAAGLDDRELVDAADAALASGVVVEETADRYRFPHDVVRRSLVDGLSGARRRMLHRRTADAIERLRAHDLDAHASALARHTAAGSDPAGDERAVRWARRASALAAQRSAPAEAARLCHQALAHVPPGRGDLEAEATTDLGIALLAAGDDAGTRALAEGADLARRHHRPDVLRRAALALADAADDRPELRTAAADLVAVALDAEPAPRLAAETDDAAVERACLLARLHRLSGDTGGRRGAAGGTTAGLTDVGAGKAPLAEALLALRDRLGRLAGPDHLDERQRLADDLAVLADAADDPASRVVASSERAMAAAIGGDGEGMHAALDEVRVVVEAHGDPVGEALLAEHAVARLTTVGRLDQARNALAEALAAIAATAEPATVEHRHRTVIDWLGGAEMPASAASATRAGRAGPAGLVGPSAAASAGDEHLHDLGVAAIAACDAGDVAAAAEVRSRLAPYTDRICSVGFRTFVGAASFHLGRLAALAGDWSEAERHLLSALRLHSACRSLPWVALTQAALADVLEVRGRPSDREWIAGLRAESEWVTSTLGLRTL